MDLQKLYQILCDGWDEQEQSLTITGKDFLDTPVGKLINNHFADGSILLQKTTKPLLENEKIKIIRGVVNQFYKLNDLQVSGEFWIDEQSFPQCRVNLVIAKSGFKLSEAFPEIKEESVDYFEYDNAVFILNSLPSELEASNIQLQKQYSGYFYDAKYESEVINGLLFTGQIRLPELLQWLKVFLNEGNFTVTGAIDILKGVPRFSLKTGEFKAIELGELSVPLYLQIVSLFQILEGEQNYQVLPTTLYRFRADVQYNYGDGQLTLPLYSDFYGTSPDLVILEADTKDLSELALDKFSKLMGNIALTEWIPKDFPGLDAVVLANLGLKVSLSNARLLEIYSTFSLNDKYTNYQLIPDLLQINEIDINFAVMLPSAEDSLQVKADLKGRACLTGTAVKGDLLVQVSALPNIEFTVELSHGSKINLTKMLENLLGQPLYLPEVDCSLFYLNGQTSPVGFTLNSALRSDITLPILNLEMKELGLYFKYGNHDGVNINALEAIRLSGKLSIYNKVDVTLVAELKAKGWKFAGSFETSDDTSLTLNDFLPPEIQLPDEFVGIGVKKGQVTVDTEEKSLEIELDTDSYIDFANLGRLESSSFKLYFAEQENKSYKWSISSKGAIKLIETSDSQEEKSYLIDIGGTLKITGEKEQFSISFEADEGSGVIKNIPLPIPYQIDSDTVEWSEMLFRIEKLSLEKKEKWHFESDFQLKLTKIPEFIGSILPGEGLHVGLKIDGTEEVSLSLKDSIFEVVIPDMKTPAVGELQAFDLGTAKVAVSNLALKLKKKSVTIEIEVDFYLPSRLNYLFGEDEDHKPKIVLFNTYQPDKPKASECLAMKFAGEIGDKSDATISISKIPIAVIEDKEKYWAICLGKDGKYGSIQIEKPTLGLDLQKGGFSAKGGFIIDNDPGIPLDILKQLLENAQLTDFAKLLPDVLSIPLSNPPHFIENGTLNVVKINEFFGNQLPTVVVEILNKIASIVNKLPKTFLDYMDLRVPAEFHFEIVITPDGGIDASLFSNPGVKMLMITPPAPMITGITLRQFSFGEMFAGQLFKLRIDADIDIFDIESLLVSLVVDDSLYKYFGNPRDYHYNIQIHKLLTIIFYQAGFPIPIPLFFDKLGIDYYGIGDNTLQSSFGFKEPGFNLKEIGSLLVDLVKFLTDSKFALDPRKVYKDFNLQFDIGPNYLKTGQLLGSKTLGLAEGVKVPSAYQLVAYLLDGFKFFDIIKFIKSIPVEYRFGSGQYVSGFVCLSMSADWIISTPEEFIKEDGYKYINIDNIKAKKFLEILPRQDESKPITEEDEGLVVFLRGTWSTKFTDLDAAFGLIMLQGKKFDIGFYLTGSVQNLFNIDLIATVKINPPDVPFELYGKNKTQFFIPGLTFFTGETTVAADMNRFAIDGSFTLLDVQNLIYFRTPKNVGGELSHEKIALSGGIEAGFLIFTGSGNISISNTGISSSLTIMGRETSLKFGMIGSETLQIAGKLPLGWTDYSMDIRITPLRNRLYVDLKSSTLAGLISLEIIFDTTMNAVKFGTSGELRLFILEMINPNPIVRGYVKVEDTGFAANGHFKLLPDGSPFNLEGDLTGNISASMFRLSGAISLTILNMGVFGGDIAITESGLAGHFTILGVRYTYGIRVWHNTLYIYGSYPFAGKDCPFYIDDKIPFLHLEKPPFLSKNEVENVIECDYPQATELLLTAYSKMMESLAAGSGSRGEEDEVLGLYKTSFEVSSGIHGDNYQLKVLRLTDGKDFFTELRDTVEKALDKKSIKYQLNITDASAVFEHAGEEEKVLIYLPQESKEEIRNIVVDFSHENPAGFYQTVVGKVYRVLK